ncbi:hypothetical protein I546_0661 [Mycobacterium kansasii 732]|nr:hypothetical protein I546_0661 [Mycobacterium kansasii 732]
MPLGRLHDVGERLVEAAMPQRNQHTLGGAEPSLATAASIARAVGLS